MFVHNLDPILVQVGPFSIYWYSIPYLLGFLFAYWVLRREQKRGTIALSKDDVSDAIVWVMASVIVGSRLGMLLWEPGYYLSNPLEILKIWKGGMAFHGGVIGALVGGWLFVRKNKKISLLRLGDILSVPMLLALALGRVGNFINGEIWGYVTTVSWCVKFPAVEGCRHPAQLYDGLGRLVGVILVLLLKREGQKEGFLLMNAILFMALSRVVTDFWREEAVSLLGLTLGQWYSLAMVVVAGYLLVAKYREEFKKLFGRASSIEAG